MTLSQHRQGLLAAIIVGVVLSVAWLAYKPALSGTFLLDDLSNLGDLQHVDDSTSALQFVLSGSAGPLGRPLALASFAMQAHQWEQGAAPFLVVNIAIHLLNACLLGTFLYLLTRGRGIAAAESRHVALAAMSVWLFMPLLASSTLMVIQRMTTMSATFVLLGLNGYLLARASAHRSADRALYGMSAALVLATLLSVLTKESGALLPVLVLVVEATLLSRPARIDAGKWRVWMAVFLGLPAALVLAYLLTRLPYPESLVLRRGFTGWERLLTEAGILWEYLLKAFIPQPGQYGPFHDAYVVAGKSIAGLTVAAWLAVAVLALVWRRKYPLFAFAALWFIAGHLLESTTIALELYFEHRNYIPIIGPVFALCAMVFSAPARYRRIAYLGLPLYVAVNAFFLFNLCSLYGNPGYATRYWYERNPDSPRAATSFATMQLETEGAAATLAALNDFVQRHPAHAYLGIPALSLSCIISPSENHQERARSLEHALPTVDFSYQVSNMLSDLLTTVGRVPCNGVDSQSVQSLAKSILLNPRYESSPGYRQLHHQILARIERQNGNTEGTLAQLNMAIAIEPTSTLNMMVVTTLVSDEQFDMARSFIDGARQNPPLNPLRKYLWNLSLDELGLYVDQTEQSLTGGETAIGRGRGEVS